MRKILSNQIKRILCHSMVVMFMVCFLLGASNVNVSANASGKCGSDVTWSISGDVLSLVGTGKMENFTDPEMAPWYENRDSIKKISVSDGITSIGNLAFYDFNQIEIIALPDSISRIGEYSFADCEKLETITLSSSLEVIDDYAFKECRALQAVQLPNILRTLGYQAFYRCESLTSITVPSSVREMDESVFAYCSNLMQATIESRITELPAWTFYGCESLNKVSLAFTITDVGNKAFYYCDQLEVIDYEGTDEEQQELLDKVKADVPDFDAVNGTKAPVASGSSMATIEKEDGTIVDVSKDVIETENAIISGTISKELEDNDNKVKIEVNVTLENEDGWQEVVDKVESYVQYQENISGTTEVNKIQVNVNLKGDIVIPSDVLSSLAGSKVNLNITTSDSTNWSMDMEQLDADNLSKAYDLKYTMTQIEEMSKDQKNLVGNAMSFLVEFNEDIPFKITVKIPLGHSYAGHYATISQKAILKDWEVIQTVVIDQNGDAYFYLDSVDKHTKYMVSIDAEGVDVSNALIPDTMSDAYGTLTDEFGNKYVVSGTKSSLGITFKQLTLIVVGVIVVCAVVVGIIMMVLFKMKAQADSMKWMMEDGIPLENPKKGKKTSKKSAKIAKRRKR